MDDTVIRLIMNPDFIRYVFGSDDESEKYWSAYLVKHSVEKRSFESAKSILLNLDKPGKYLSLEEKEKLRKRIENIVLKAF